MNTYTKEYKSRSTYYKRIEPFIDTDIIKVIVGQRRVGKSYLLFEIMSKLLAKDPQADIIYINKELNNFDPIKNYNDLLTFIETNKTGKGKCYLFLDEIQDIEEWEKALRHLFAIGGYDIYCTGSNARLLSGEMATFLSGRYIEFKMNSLSYPEFLKFHELEESAESFEKFYKYGGLPYLVNVSLSDRIAYEYAYSTYNSIVLKDVVERYKLRNIRLLNDLTTYMADNIGTAFSATRISMYLRSQRIDLSTRVILEYLQYLESAFILKRVKRADLKGKKIFEISEKYYFEDLGIRNSLVGYKPTDFARILENIVYQHLVYKGYKVFIGKLDEKEIDFVAEQDGERVYIQVTTYITEEKTREREFGNLLEIKDNYPKLVVSMEDTDGGSYKGIQQMNIRKFLTQWDNASTTKPKTYPERDFEQSVVSDVTVEYFNKRYNAQVESLKHIQFK